MLTDFYFKPSSFEKRVGKRIYKIMGIKFWKRFLRDSSKPKKYWKTRTQCLSRRQWLIETFNQQEKFTRKYELRHIAGGLAMQVSGIVYILITGKGSILLLTVLNMFFNGYPILLQRYNRIRISESLHRIRKA